MQSDWRCLQSCTRKPEEQPGAPLAIAGVENMGRLVAAITHEWEVATHNATMAALREAEPPAASEAAVPNGAAAAPGSSAAGKQGAAVAAPAGGP